MKIARCLVFMLIGIGSESYAQEWIPFQGYSQPPQVIQQYNQIYQPQPVVIYQWTPVVVQQNFVLEQRYLLCKKQIIVTQPVTQWVYQPIVVYR